MAISSAIGQTRVSRIVGYEITPGNFQTTSPNLPQRIAVLGEANTANQPTLDTNPKVISNLQEAGEAYGYGSPLYTMIRILLPTSGGGVEGIPVVAYPQSSTGATASVRDITPTGVATGNGTHTVVINGRDGVEGERYDFNVEDGDTVADVSGKIRDAINSVLGSPVTATATGTEATATSKWTGLTSEDINISIDVNGDGLGFTYAVTTDTAGAGTPAVTTSLGLFGTNWNTLVVNPYSVASVLNELEAFNGKPSATSGGSTGRYVGIVFKPFVALFGSTAEDDSAITDARKAELTNALCPAPNSNGLPMEAAANMCVLCAVTAQNTPHLDVNAKSYPDMPVPSDGQIGIMDDYNNRDILVKKGSSTVAFVNNNYEVQDFITTYHPDGENPPQYRYVRNLMLDYNVRYTYLLLEEINVVDKTIANDQDIVNVSDFIKPKQWKAIVDEMANDLSGRALIADPSFTQESITVAISGTNPDRLETFFKYKRTGIARISSTTAQAGFNFGS